MKTRIINIKNNVIELRVKGIPAIRVAVDPGTGEILIACADNPELGFDYGWESQSKIKKLLEAIE